MIRFTLMYTLMYILTHVLALAAGMVFNYLVEKYRESRV